MMQSEPSRRPDDQQQQERPPPAPDSWEVVRRCKQKVLSAPDKIAWLQVWLETDQGRRLWIGSATDIGHWQGTSGDAGFDRIENLSKQGFWFLRPHGGKKGVYHVEVVDPRFALRALGRRDPQMRMDWLDEIDGRATFRPVGEDASGELRVVRPDGVSARSLHQALTEEPPAEPPEVLRQGRLAEDPPEDPRQMGELPPEDPPSDATSLHLDQETRKSTSHFSNFTSPEVKWPSARASNPEVPPATGRGSSGTSSADRDEADLTRLIAQRQAELARDGHRVPAAADEGTLAPLVLAKLDAAMSPAAREQRVSELLGIQLRRVRDPKMFHGPCLDVAWAILDGLLNERDMYGALNTLDETDARGLLKGTRSQYYNGAVKKLLRRCGAYVDRSPPHKPK